MTPPKKKKRDVAKQVLFCLSEFDEELDVESTEQALSEGAWE